MWIQSVLFLGAAVTLSSAASFADEANQLERLGAIKRSKDERLQRDKRVVGGSTFSEGEWPHLVRLKGKCPRDFFWGIPYNYVNYYCGGVLLGRKWVLTAAHCFQQQGNADTSMTPKYWHAKAGEITLNDWNDHWDSKQVHGKRIFIHPEYNEGDLWRHDLALVKLKKNLPSISEIQSVALPYNKDSETWPAVGEYCWTKGWGCTQTDGDLQQYARHVDLPIISEAACASVYGIQGNDRICAGEVNGNEGICGGDSGGPLVCDVNGVWTLVGIASFTSSSNVGDYPSVFTRITEHLDWIETTMANN